jgi:dihydroflavonol-4-reductase
MPTAPIGVGDHNLTPPSAMIRDLALGRIPTLLDCQLDLVDVEAVADATIAALDSGTSGERYLLAGEMLSLQHLASLIAEISGTKAPNMKVPLNVALLAARAEAVVSRLTKRPPKAPLTGVRLAARPVRFSSAKAREKFGFAPRPVVEVLSETVRWLMEAERI